MESAGEGVAKWCPEVARSCSSQINYLLLRIRIKSVGEGVAGSSVCVSRSRLAHVGTVACVLERV